MAGDARTFVSCIRTNPLYAARNTLGHETHLVKKIRLSDELVGLNSYQSMINDRDHLSTWIVPVRPTKLTRAR